MPIERWIARAAGGTNHRLKPGSATIRSRLRSAAIRLSWIRFRPAVCAAADSTYRSAGTGARPEMPFVRLAIGLVLVFASPLLAQQPPARPSWLVADSVAKTVNLTLEVAGAGGGPSALINGYRSGAVQVIVPLNWTVTWH